MQFRVLGVVDAVSAGRQVDLGQARLRCVLAVLLVDANQVVSMDQLMERVWDADPPQRGLSVLYTYMSRLRTALAVEPDVTIQRRAGGYQLTVDEDSVDLHRFRDLIGAARVVDDDTHALALFDQGLRLWRGRPFADLDTPWLASIRTALEVERQAAQLERTDAALRCGQHAQLVAELGTRAAQQPWDERVAGQLMLALAATGRQADALSTYQRTRNALVDQLGLEPGPDLRHLHQRLLAGDTSVVVPVPPATRSDVVVPRQLPAPARHFTGRHAELDTLTGILDPARGTGETVVISAIDGMAGIGKTALAVHAAHRLADRFPDGVLFIDLHGFTPRIEPTPPEQALDQLLRGLGVPGPQIPGDLDARVGLYRSVVARRRVLIVLDNAAHEAQLAPLLPGTHACAVIVTSRRHLAGLDDATHLSLPLLDPAEAADLFRGLAGDRATPADQAAIGRIVALCGQLPLAIRITAARLRQAAAATPAAVCGELEEALGSGSRLDWLSDGHRAVTSALDVSYQHLTAHQQHALRQIGLHPGSDIEPYAMAALADTSLDRARRLLDDLHASSLLHQPAYRRYRLHDLVAAYTTTLTARLPESDRHAALHRLYDHYAATSSRAMDLVYPWEADHRRPPPTCQTPTPVLADRNRAQSWLDTETGNLLAAAHHAATGQLADHTLHQSVTLHWQLRSRGQYAQAAQLHQLALRHAKATANRTGEQDALNGLGHIHRLAGQYGPATDCFQQVLTIARRTGDPIGQQNGLLGLGIVLQLQGRQGPATECLEQALDLARQTGDRTGQQDALYGLGYVHHLQRRPGQATDCFEQALHIARQTGNRTGEQNGLLGLGDVHYGQGRHGPATDCFEQALDIARQMGNRTGEQNALLGLGDVHYGQGRHGPATDYYARTLAIADQTGNRNVQFEAHQGLGRVHHTAARQRDALHHHQAALHLAVDLDQPTDQARAHDGLARAYRAAGDPGQARHHWQAALDLLTSIDTDHTDEPDVTTATIRTHLADLEDRPAPGAHDAGGLPNVGSDRDRAC